MEVMFYNLRLSKSESVISNLHMNKILYHIVSNFDTEQSWAKDIRYSICSACHLIWTLKSHSISIKIVLFWHTMKFSLDHSFDLLTCNDWQAGAV